MLKFSKKFKIESREQSPLVPLIKFNGQWLHDLGFAVNAVMRVEATSHKLVLTVRNEDEYLPDILKTILADYNSDEAEVQAKRYSAYIWLQNNIKESKALQKYMHDIDKSFVQTETAFDLVVALLDAKLIT